MGGGEILKIISFYIFHDHDLIWAKSTDHSQINKSNLI